MNSFRKVRKTLVKIITVLATVSLCFAGCTNHDSTTKTEGVPAAAIVSPSEPPHQTAAERAFAIKLSSTDVGYIRGELDETAFDDLIRKTNPDIGSVKYHSPADYDADEIAAGKRNFRRALYFAKKIQLANGGTMFDWLKSCPYSMGENMSASRVPVASGAYEPFASKLSFMDASYFPILMMKGIGEKDDIALTWIIYEDGTVKALTSRASVYLTNPKFETMSATDCRA